MYAISFAISGWAVLPGYVMAVLGGSFFVLLLMASVGWVLWGSFQESAWREPLHISLKILTVLFTVVALSVIPIIYSVNHSVIHNADAQFSEHSLVRISNSSELGKNNILALYENHVVLCHYTDMGNNLTRITCKD